MNCTEEREWTPEVLAELKGAISEYHWQHITEA